MSTNPTGAGSEKKTLARRGVVWLRLEGWFGVEAHTWHKLTAATLNQILLNVRCAWQLMNIGAKRVNPKKPKRKFK